MLFDWKILMSEFFAKEHSVRHHKRVVRQQPKERAKISVFINGIKRALDTFCTNYARPIEDLWLELEESYTAKVQQNHVRHEGSDDQYCVVANRRHLEKWFAAAALVFQSKFEDVKRVHSTAKRIVKYVKFLGVAKDLRP
jgi:hypothetical protein